MAYMAKTAPSQRYPRGGYKARYRDKTQKVRSKTFATKVEAQRWLDLNSADLARGEWQDPSQRRRLYDEWAQLWIDGLVAYAPTTRASSWRLFKKHIEPAFTGWAIGDIDFAAVKTFIRAKQRAGYSPKYLRAMVWILAGILQEAVDAGAIRSNPARGHKLPRKKNKIGMGDVFDMEQAVRLLRELPEWVRSPVWLLVLAGLRPSEACGLTVKRFDPVHHRIRAGKETALFVSTYDGIPAHVEKGDGKTASADRTNKIPEWLSQEISRELAERPKKTGRPVHRDDPLFLDWRDSPLGNGQPLRTDVLRRIVRPALARAGLPAHFRNYDLRHTYASLLFEAGHSPLEVGASMGHSEPSISQNTYGHLFKGWQEKLSESLEASRQKAEQGIETPNVIPIRRLEEAGSDI